LESKRVFTTHHIKFFEDVFPFKDVVDEDHAFNMPIFGPDLFLDHG
jgi:hypothetical protein